MKGKTIGLISLLVLLGILATTSIYAGTCITTFDGGSSNSVLDYGSGQLINVSINISAEFFDGPTYPFTSNISFQCTANTTYQQFSTGNINNGSTRTVSENSTVLEADLNFTIDDSFEDCATTINVDVFNQSAAENTNDSDWIPRDTCTLTNITLNRTTMAITVGTDSATGKQEGDTDFTATTNQEVVGMDLVLGTTGKVYTLARTSSDTTYKNWEYTLSGIDLFDWAGDYYFTSTDISGGSLTSSAYTSIDLDPSSKGGVQAELLARPEKKPVDNIVMYLVIAAIVVLIYQKTKKKR